MRPLSFVRRLKRPLPLIIVVNRKSVILPLQFTAVLLKVASRCNLDCDYCYVYKHADQSWRSQPRLMSDDVVQQFALRLKEYTDSHALPEFAITFHGGEPLLFGGPGLRRIARTIRETVGRERSLKFSLQTNGTLLTDECLAELEQGDIAVSLSLDGPKAANDRHRLDHSGRSSFDATFAAIQRLTRCKSSIFSGVIAVIDPSVSPRELFEFFSRLNIPRLDLLLPDATHDRLPPRREESPDLYSSWLKEAFQLWFREFPALPVRWFDSLLASRLGIPSPTDAMGLGSVSLIVIDTDGSYTDHDVFKITAPGGRSLKMNVFESAFEDVARHPDLAEHSFRLTLPGLASQCRSCPVVEACGGGSVMHRWDQKLGLEAPSVYCEEIFGVLETATAMLKESLPDPTPMSAAALICPGAGGAFVAECRRWRQNTEARASEAAKRLGVERKGESAAALLLADKHAELRCRPIPAQHAWTGEWLGSIRLQSEDERLFVPFLGSIRMLKSDSLQVKHGIETLAAAGKLLASFNPSLPDAFATLISDVIFVESTVESRDRIFSFSDDSAPNVLYVAPNMGDIPLPAEDLADSLLHEFLHQVLYQIESEGPMLFDHVYPRFPAPWRDGLRPSGGFFHGAFVFAGLAAYWASLARTKPQEVDCRKACENAERFATQAVYGINSLRAFALLTRRGKQLLEQISATLPLEVSPMKAPGRREIRAKM